MNQKRYGAPKKISLFGIRPLLLLFFLLLGSCRPSVPGPLVGVSADELVAELESRSAEATQPKLASPLSELTSRELLRELHIQERGIYGVDDRKDLYEVRDKNILVRAESIAALIPAPRLVPQKDRSWRLQAPSYREHFRVCKDELFSEQPTAANCTAFLIGKDLIATAGHCAHPSKFKSLKVIFGFQMLTASKAALIFPDRDVYEPIEIVGRAEEPQGPDWAVLRLSRTVERRLPLRLRTLGSIVNSREVFVIGHPMGLPAKYAPNAIVRDNRPKGYFIANLDTYGGNSGSPVFNALTGEVEGILVRGERDLVRLDEGCSRSRICPDLGCRGEEVTRIREILPVVQAAADRAGGRSGGVG